MKACPMVLGKPSHVHICAYSSPFSISASNHHDNFKETSQRTFDSHTAQQKKNLPWQILVLNLMLL